MSMHHEQRGRGPPIERRRALELHDLANPIHGARVQVRVRRHGCC